MCETVVPKVQVGESRSKPDPNVLGQRLDLVMTDIQVTEFGQICLIERFQGKSFKFVPIELDML